MQNYDLDILHSVLPTSYLWTLYIKHTKETLKGGKEKVYPGISGLGRGIMISPWLLLLFREPSLRAENLEMATPAVKRAAPKVLERKRQLNRTAVLLSTVTTHLQPNTKPWIPLL